MLFIERCLSMLKPSGRLGIVLPETLFHAPTSAYVRQYLLSGNNVTAIVSLPHNTFRPHCNAKTCLIVLRKDETQGECIMATPEEMGHGHTGHELTRPGTNDIWDDLSEVVDEIKQPGKDTNKHVFTVKGFEINPDILVPKFYRYLKYPPGIGKDRLGISLISLLNDGTIEAWGGMGSPASAAKGKGEVPYIRVSDIVNWELYRNPVTGIPEEVYQQKRGNVPLPEEGDVIFVRRGSYRIGTVAMVSPRDKKVLLTRELLTFRVVDEDNKHGITPFYLLALLSSADVQKQIDNLVYVDTTLPNIGDRWKYLVLPVHAMKKDIRHLCKQVETVMRQKWDAQEGIDKMRAKHGEMVT